MNFTEIEAYRDNQVNDAVLSMLKNKDFLNLMVNTPALLEMFKLKSFEDLISKFKNISTVKEFQNVMFVLLKHNIKITTDGVSYSNENNVLDKDNVLFISNHRSTSLDAAYLNYILNHIGMKTAYSGAGDNIFATKWLGHLIRLNKGFMIKRNVEDIDEKIEEAVILAKYINTLLLDNNSVWISQQSGRAKDGIDKTDSVVITMLNKFDESKDYEKWLNSVCLIPVCISWELIPCVEFMVNDFLYKSKNKEFVDRKNILHEISSFKGRVHYNFGKRVVDNRRSKIVKKIDKEILSNYILWETNWYAYLKSEDLNNEDKKIIENNIDVQKGKELLESYKFNEKENKVLYSIYGNSIRSALKYEKSLKELVVKNNEMLKNIKLVD